MMRVPVRIPRWLKLSYVVVVAAMLAWVLVDAGPDLLESRALLSAPGPHLFVATWFGMAVLLGALWALLLRMAFGVRVPLRVWLRAQSIAWGGRYLPGKLGLLAGKASLAEREGIGWRGLGYSVLFEQLAFVVSGLVVALVLIGSPATLPEGWQPAWLSAHWTGLRLSVTALALAGFVVGLAWLGRRMKGAGRLTSTGSAGLLLLYLLPHLLVGVGAYVVLVEVAPGAAALGVAYVIGLLALAHAAGVLAVFAPAGLGVREAVLAAGLAPHLSLPDAIVFATLLRLLSLVADALFFSLGLAMRVCNRG